MPFRNPVVRILGTQIEWTHKNLMVLSVREFCVWIICIFVYAKYVNIDGVNNIYDLGHLNKNDKGSSIPVQ